MAKLYISLDPGFDAVKVVANGRTFKFPFVAEETDERAFTDCNLRSDFILYRNEQGITYRVGQYARELIFNNKDSKALDSRMAEFYSEKRFVSPEFRVGLRTAIAMAICACDLEAESNLEIFLMVTLPHSICKKYDSAIIGNAAGDHKFSLKQGKEEEKNYSFTIHEDHIHTVSQTIAAIYGETSDDDGNLDEEKFIYLSNGPTLVIDGGYYTTGLVVVSRGGSVDNSKTESDTEHAMRNVNEAMASAIQDKRSDLRHFMVEYLLQTGGKIRYLEDGKYRTIDMIQLRADMAKNVCADLIKHLDEKYNYLLDINYILVTGGTGVVFFDQIKENYLESGLLDEDHIILTNAELNGEFHSIEFAVSIGAYKALLGILNDED